MERESSTEDCQTKSKSDDCCGSEEKRSEQDCYDDLIDFIKIKIKIKDFC